MAEHGVGVSNLYPLDLEPPEQAEQLTIALKGVSAQIAARETGMGPVTISGLKHPPPQK